MSTAAFNESTMKPQRLPQWAPWGVGGLAVILAVGLQILSGHFDLTSFSVVGALLYLIGITSASLIVEGRRWGIDTLMRSLVIVAFILVMIPLVSLIWMVISQGVRSFSFAFLTGDMKGLSRGEIAGAGHAILGTLWVTFLASVISIPIGVMTAIYLVEYGAKSIVAKVITFLTDVMTGIPSIVAGLFAFSLFSILVGPRYQSALVGAVALSLLMIPVVIRSVEEMLRLVPHELREASYALGVPKWLTIIKVVLRTAIAGVTTGVMIAIARVIGETAPLLLTVGNPTGFNTNPFNKAMSTLPVYVYSMYTSGRPTDPNDPDVALAWAGALTLIVIVMLLNLFARFISKVFSPKSGR